MKKILTVVIPAYNIEKYIENCLDSFVIPEVLEDLEVLIVNDGSKDRSADLAAAYEKRYPNSFRVINKENGGHGSTINRGLLEASGKYFKVVDGDDWVEREAFLRLMDCLKGCTITGCARRTAGKSRSLRSHLPGLFMEKSTNFLRLVIEYL